jgi:hypothetical protein
MTVSPLLAGQDFHVQVFVVERIRFAGHQVFVDRLLQLVIEPFLLVVLDEKTKPF